MKILQVIHCFPPEPVGGAERVALSLVKGLIRRGHRVSVFAGSLRWERGFRVDREEYQGIPVLRVRRDDPWYDRWDACYNPTVEWVFRNHLRRERPDLVHVHHWIRLTSNLVQIAREEGVPAVVHLHDLHVTCPRTFRVKPDQSFCSLPPSPGTCLSCVERWPFQGDLEVRTSLSHYLRDFLNELRCAHLVLAPTETHGKTVASFLPGEIGPMGVLPPGWEDPLKGKTRTGGKGRPLRLAHWGNLYDLKGTLLLVRAFRKASAREPMDLVILGEAVESSFGEELRRAAEGLPLEFRGAYRREELASLGADLAVFPSLCYESYSLALDEAFMLGLPAIVSDAGALPERVGEGGWVVPRGDEEALVEALVRAARDRDLLARKAASLPRIWGTADETARAAEGYYQGVLRGESVPLPPLRPLGPVQRLNRLYALQAHRLATLLGAKEAWPSGWRQGGGKPRRDDS